MILFTAFGNPVGQPRPRARAIRIGGKWTARIYRDEKHPVYEYRTELKAALRRTYTGEPLEGPLILEAVFYMPRPKGKIWKTKAMPAYSHTSKPDLDNLIKPVKDAINGIAFKDDSQVCQYGPETRKVVCSGHEEPRTVVRIWQQKESLA